MYYTNKVAQKNLISVIHLNDLCLHEIDQDLPHQNLCTNVNKADNNRVVELPKQQTKDKDSDLTGTRCHAARNSEPVTTGN